MLLDVIKYCGIIPTLIITIPIGGDVIPKPQYLCDCITQHPAQYLSFLPPVYVGRGYPDLLENVCTYLHLLK